MKVHYIYILLFALPLNILVYNQRNHKSTTSPTPKIPTTRLLCEFELYAPANYDNDQEMKEVMQQFERHTSQRFHEYDERIKTTRQKYKDKCDNEIQKIILKDKLEKELTEKFATLHTDIHSDAIPTCICERSMEDKVEKTYLKCTQNLGGIVAPSSGVLGGITEGALYAWKPKALETTIAAALKANTANISSAVIKAGQVAGKNALIEGLNALKIEELGIASWEPLINPVDYTKVSGIIKIIFDKKTEMCGLTKVLGDSTCEGIELRIGTSVHIVPQPPPDIDAIGQTINGIAAQAEGVSAKAAEAAESSRITTIITKKQTALIEAGFNTSTTSIYASIIAILIIVLIMVIIYLILRYRRKKKIKKKLQYMKFLEE
ncbi:PIR protein, putative [Plasmodium sp. gorilla clade G1]|nr:PIR protein, putative [Plasmodium sp. gorilla clade G1]